MIKVLNILETISSGGVERRRLSLAKLLDKKEFELKIICTHAVGDFPDEFKKHGVEIIVIGNPNPTRNYKSYLKVIKVIKEFKPDIIHGAVFEGVTLAAITGFLCRVPAVVIEETSDPQNRTWKGNLLMRFFSLLSDKVVGVSPAAVNYLIHKIKINPNKVQLIENGILIPREVSVLEQQKLKSQLGIFENEIVIGSVGRMLMDSHKRFSDLINAFKLLLDKNIKAKLILVGDGKERDNYIELTKKLKIEDNVQFVGYHTDTEKFYSIFDIFSLVSAREAFGLVLAEAMLHKLPIVATRVGGMQYIVDDNETGFLVERYNVNEIAEKLELLCNNHDLTIKMGKKGYEKAMNNYTEEIYINKVASLYMELMKFR